MPRFGENYGEEEASRTHPAGGHRRLPDRRGGTDKVSDLVFGAGLDQSCPDSGQTRNTT